jgi:hypothetical protein
MAMVRSAFVLRWTVSASLIMSCVYPGTRVDEVCVVAAVDDVDCVSKSLDDICQWSPNEAGFLVCHPEGEDHLVIALHEADLIVGGAVFDGRFDRWSIRRPLTVDRIGKAAEVCAVGRFVASSCPF